MRKIHRHVAIVIGSLVVGCSNVAAESLVGRPALGQSLAEKVQPRLLADAKSTPSLRIRLPALTAVELTKVQLTDNQAKFHIIGVGRAVPTLDKGVAIGSLAWNSAADGTRYAVIEIDSPGAAALRASLRPHDLTKGMSVLVYGTAHPELVYGPFSSEYSNLSRPDSIWLPVVEGEVLRLELRIAAGASFGAGGFTVPRLSHLVTSVRSETWLKDLSDIDQAGTCNIDIACPPSDATWVTRGQSVAKYVVTTAFGDSGTCTGTLLNSTGPAPPNYFLTANHCVNTVGAANSMHFYWFFQRTTCGGPVPTTLNESTGGATFIKTVPANDHTLVQLNAAPPVGTTLAGWTTTSLTGGEAVVGLHHPRGDLKKFSAGTQQGFTDYSDSTVTASANHIRVFWNPAQGTTEGGSSGSALFNNAGLIVGTLHGGQASCASQASPDWYGRFDQAYATLQPWLSPGPNGPPPPDAPAPPITVDLTTGVAVSGLVAEDEDKWYRIQTNAGDSLTVTLTGLTADADLYVFRNTQGGTYTCRSIQLLTANESCTVNSAAASTWYIDVFGYEAANYTVTATVSATPTPGRGRGSSGGGALSISYLALLVSLLLGRVAYSQRQCGPR